MVLFRQVLLYMYNVYAKLIQGKLLIVPCHVLWKIWDCEIIIFKFQNWPESTDPQKFVYEDIAIATYLLVINSAISFFITILPGKFW